MGRDDVCRKISFRVHKGSRVPMRSPTSSMVFGLDALVPVLALWVLLGLRVSAYSG
jgi:hypothetical protein